MSRVQSTYYIRKQAKKLVELKCLFILLKSQFAFSVFRFVELRIDFTQIYASPHTFFQFFSMLSSAMILILDFFA